MDIFERATRAQLRFGSTIGELTTEQVWDLPLLAKNSNRPDLDSLARGISRSLRDLDADSFVEVKPDPRKTELQLQLDIIKHIIAAKIEEKKAAETRAANAQRKKKLLDALAAKDDQALAGMSRAEIEAEIAKLGEAA